MSHDVNIQEARIYILHDKKVRECKILELLLYGVVITFSTCMDVQYVRALERGDVITLLLRIE